jgi:hypothetical protein
MKLSFADVASKIVELKGSADQKECTSGNELCHSSHLKFRDFSLRKR